MIGAKTHSVREKDIRHEWLLLDAQGQTLGRLATRISNLLRGKHKPTYSTHLDVGDYVIVINADKVKLTGDKENQKMYYRHTNYPGGLKETQLRLLREKSPTRIVEYAVSGMMAKNKLGRAMLRKLKVYAGDQHPHTAQQPRIV